MPGAWLFHIGLLEGSDIELPPSTDSKLIIPYSYTVLVNIHDKFGIYYGP